MLKENPPLLQNLIEFGVHRLSDINENNTQAFRQHR